jgi:hypothetical protein
LTQRSLRKAAEFAERMRTECKVGLLVGIEFWARFVC